jgi:hypothetical protein
VKMRLRVLLILVLAAASVVATPQRAAANAIGPYTFPFFSPHTVTQGYGPTNCTCEPPGHGYPHWHNGIDWGMPIGTKLAATNAGTVASYKEDLYDGQGPDQYGQGNFVFVSHGSSRWSLYYHLTHNGVLDGTGTTVSAGQYIAQSGNTGFSSGPHLHYSLMLTATCQSNTCDTDPRLWTTSPGRVPWLATYYSENNAGTVFIIKDTTVTHWVKFKNTGGRTWVPTNDSNGRGSLLLYSTTSTGMTSQASLFQALDWPSSIIATGLDVASVPPDGIATFTFGLKASPSVGYYPNNYFNLRASSLWWFDYATLGSYFIPIEVDPNCDTGC